jgi:hypothetical protein
MAKAGERQGFVVGSRSTVDESRKKMKIISGWKDYYDHVAHQFGGGDPKVIYHRDYVVEDKILSDGSPIEDTLRVRHYSTPSIPHTLTLRHSGHPYTQRHEFRALVIMNRVFILERSGNVGALGGIAEIRRDWHVTSRPILDLPMNGPFALLKDMESLAGNVSAWQRKKMDDYMYDSSMNRYLLKQGWTSEIARKLCIEVGAPVFLIDGNNAPVVMGRTPKLSVLGLPAYIDAQQLYQELAMFVGNVLNPVEQPSSSMTDKEKVVSHGFDKKISFRHRK